MTRILRIAQSIRSAALVALLPLTLAATPASAEPFTLLIWETPADLALRTHPGAEGQAYWAAYGQFAQSLAASGTLRGGAPLVPPAPGELAITSPDGLILGGYFQLEAADRATAQALADQVPAVTRGGAAEVRGHDPAAPAMDGPPPAQ